MGLGAGAITSIVQEKTYGATNPLVVSPARGFLDPQDASELPALADTVARLSETATVLEGTAEEYVRLAPTSEEAKRRRIEATDAWLRDHVSAQTVGASSIIQIKGEGTSQASALDLTAAAADSLSRETGRAQQSFGPAGATTGVLVQKLKPQADGQIRPSTVRNLLAGGLAGGLIGVAAAFLLGIARRRIWSREQLMEALDAPILGELRYRKRSRSAYGRLDTIDPLLEGIWNQRPGPTTLLVTGAAPFEMIEAVAALIATSLAARDGNAPTARPHDEVLGPSWMLELTLPLSLEGAAVLTQGTLQPVDSPDPSVISAPPLAAVDKPAWSVAVASPQTAVGDAGQKLMILNGPRLRNASSLLPLLKSSAAAVVVINSGASARQLRRQIDELEPWFSLRPLGTILVR